MISGIGYVAPAPLAEMLSGRLSAAPDPTPEITAFEVPEGVPSWGFEVLDLGLDKALPHIKSFVDRTSALALVAAQTALADAGLRRLPEQSADEGCEIGCAYGTTLGCLEAMTIFWNKVKSSNPKFAQPLPFTHGYANSPSSLLCIEYKLRGPAATFSGEKLVGLEALTFAFDQIASGAGEIMLVGASESLTPAAHNHLFATRQLSASGRWDDGLVPGEGAAMLVLESLESARRRSAQIYAELEGVNFFPHPQQAQLPIGVATDPHQSIEFVSVPNIDRSGRRVQPLRFDVPAVATKYYTGDMLSVSPLLGVALAAATMRGTYAPVGAGGTLPLLQPIEGLSQPRQALAAGYDLNGYLGVAMLKKT